MYAERGFCRFLLFRIASCGPIDCGPAVRGRIGWISCQVTFLKLFVIALTYHRLCLGDRRGDLDEVIVAAASEAIAHTYTTCFSECCYHVVYGVCMDLLSHAPLGQSACMYGRRGFLRLPCFRSCFSLESLRGCRAGSRSGLPCLHASIAVPRGGAWSASHPWSPDLT